MVHFDRIQRKLFYQQRSVKLGYRDAQVLNCLIQHSPQAVERKDIIHYAWGSEFIGETSLAKSISALRRAFTKLGIQQSFIITEPKVGYRLVAGTIILELTNGTETNTDANSLITNIGCNASGKTSKSAQLKLSVNTFFQSFQGLIYLLGQLLKNCLIFAKAERAKTLYILTLCLLISALGILFYRLNQWRLFELPHPTLNSVELGQVKVFYPANNQIPAELEGVLANLDCNCHSYIEQAHSYQQISVINRQTHQVINIFYQNTEINDVVNEIQRFVEEAEP
ncbi:winged helix-turn-helix domain-containing protein [Spartinivicinus ruber]|uniref:winged helix-turn-helix domain-containing protein n=1 Tax=Spartinivicinus ruber TaxID=2683272 RepID=UPI0013D7AB11|nr:winged helix-turn-helix domain-containing protein [Spartinivicinus ruber]